MDKTTSIVIGLVLIGAIGALVYWQSAANIEAPENLIEETRSATSTPETSEEETVDENPVASPVPRPPTEPTNPPTTPPSGPQRYTMAEVALHASASSCWSAINGSVYDLTSWIPKHPGGPDKILQLCGTNGSTKFNNKHGGAATQANILAGFKIGVVAN